MAWTRVALKDLNLTPYISTGSAVAYNISVERITEYSDKETFFIDFHTICGDAPTLNINWLGAKNITIGWINLSTGQIISNSWYFVKYSLSLDKFIVVGWGGWGGWGTTWVNWTRKEETFDSTIPSSDTCSLSFTPMDENAIFVFKKDSWLTWFNTLDYSYNDITNIVKLTTPLTVDEEVLIKYMIETNFWVPTQITANNTWIYPWITSKPLMIYKNWLYMHETTDYNYSWTTITFIEPTQTIDIIIFII